MNPYRYALVARDDVKPEVVADAIAHCGIDIDAPDPRDA